MASLTLWPAGVHIYHTPEGSAGPTHYQATWGLSPPSSSTLFSQRLAGFCTGPYPQFQDASKFLLAVCFSLVLTLEILLGASTLAPWLLSVTPRAAVAYVTKAPVGASASHSFPSSLLAHE